MAKKTLWTQEELRAELLAKLRGRKMVAVCEEIGVKPNHLSQVANGGNINGEILKWLGYEKTEAFYRKRTVSQQ